MHIKPKKLVQFIVELGVGIGAVLLIVTAANRIPELPPIPYPLPPAPIDVPLPDPPTFIPEGVSGEAPEWVPPATGVPKGYSRIDASLVGKDERGNEIIVRNATVRIPELGLEKFAEWGSFEWLVKLPDPYPITEDGYGLFVTLEVDAPGFGRHKYINLPLAPQDISYITLHLTQGDRETLEAFGPSIEERKNRPSNFSPPRNPKGAIGPDTPLTIPPRYIRVAIRANGSNGLPDPNGPVLGVEQVEFEYYVKNVLPREWNSLWNPESLKAGAEAVREYAWYWVNQGGNAMNSALGADVDNSTNSQVYVPESAKASTNAAVDAVWSSGWKKNGVVFQSFYCAGTPNSPTSTCVYGGPYGSMSQNGSQYLATSQGMNYQQILNYYYSAPSAPVMYYPTPPQTPKPFATGVASNYTTFQYAAPGATYYYVIKWLNGAWQPVYNGGNTAYLDYQAALANYYAVAAWNSAGWTPYSFNQGHMAMSAGTYATQPPLTYAYPAGNRIRLTYKMAGDPWYYVIRWNGLSWVNVYAGTASEFNDANLSPQTARYYAVAAWKPSIGWTPYTNYSGYVTSTTYQGQ